MGLLKVTKKAIGRDKHPKVITFFCTKWLTSTASLAPSTDSMGDKTPQSERPTEQQPSNEVPPQTTNSKESSRSRSELSLSSTLLQISRPVHKCSTSNIATSPAIPPSIAFARFPLPMPHFATMSGTMSDTRTLLLAMGLVERDTSQN